MGTLPVQARNAISLSPLNQVVTPITTKRKAEKHPAGQESSGDQNLTAHREKKSTMRTDLDFGLFAGLEPSSEDPVLSLSKARSSPHDETPLSDCS